MEVTTYGDAGSLWVSESTFDQQRSLILLAWLLAVPLPTVKEPQGNLHISFQSVFPTNFKERESLSYNGRRSCAPKAYEPQPRPSKEHLPNISYSITSPPPWLMEKPS